MAKKVALVADDDLQIQEMIKHYLEHFDFDVITCNNGISTLNALETKRVNLLILDINMPSLDGIGVLKTLRSDLKTKKIPVLMLTKSNDLKDVSEVKKYQVSDYIIKPPKKSDFLLRVEKAMADYTNFDDIYIKEEEQIKKVMCEIEFELVSIGKKGMILRSIFPLKFGRSLKNFKFPFLEDSPFNLDSLYVSNCEKAGEKDYFIYVSFITTNKEERENIDNFLASHKPKV